MRILSLAPLAGPGFQKLLRHGTVELDPWDEREPIRLHDPDELAERLDGVDVLLVEADRVSSEVIENAKRLRIIGTCRGDPVNVDIGAATRAGIPVLRAPGRNADAVAELTVGLILALLRGIVQADDDVRAGRWIIDQRIPQQRFRSRELWTLTVGLIGCGAVGRATGRRLALLGCRVLGFDPYVNARELRDLEIEPVALKELLEASDVVSIHAVVTDETIGLIGEQELALMKDGTYLVNTARYAIVEEQPMIDALRTGRLAGGAFDHFEGEFLMPDHPLISMPNVILTPHVGGQTVQTIENHTRAMADGLEALLSGREPPNLVNAQTFQSFLARR
jgi:D-3-phosphoglycerate dehydrogenase